MRKPQRIAAFGFVVVLAAACADARATEQAPPAIIANADQEAPIPLQCETSSLHLQHTLTLGSEDPTHPQFLSRISDVGVDSLGIVYILDGRSNVVKTFDDRGGLVREIRLGELDAGLTSNGPAGMAITESGRIVVLDSFKRRATILSPESTGDYVLESALTVLETPAPNSPVSMTAGDRYGLAVAVRLRQGETLFEQVDLRDRDGRRQTVVGPDAVTSARIVQSGSIRSVVQLATDISDRTPWTLTPSGEVFWAPRGQYRILRNREGNTSEVIARDFAPLRVSSRDREVASSLAGTTNLEWSAVEALLPRFKTPIIGLHATDEFLFVRLSTAEPSTYHAEYDVYRRADSSSCGRIRLDAVIFDIQGSNIVAVRFNPDSPSRVLKIRILNEREVA